MKVQLLYHTLDPELTVVNAARVSFVKWSDELKDADVKLIKYLHEHEHSSPFRHATFTFRAEAPIFVARQVAKHVVGVAWNEQSGRYIQFTPKFWAPETFRSKALDKKQGSGPDLPDGEQDELLNMYDIQVRSAFDCYCRLLDRGVCEEQSRAVLPLALHTMWIWTLSLEALLHFLRLRLDSHAQQETRDFATLVKAEVQDLLPNILKLVLNEEAQA